MVELSRALAAAHRSGERIKVDAEELPDSLALAETVQDGLLQELGWSAAAWKLGATSHAARKSLGLDGAFSGLLPADRILESGAQLPRTRLEPAGVECELMAVMSGDLPASGAPYSRNAVIDAILGIGTGIEIPQPRFPGLGFYGGPALVADNGAAGWGVIGSLPGKPEDLDGARLMARVEVDGALVAEGNVDAFVAPPLDLLVDHINRMAARGWSTHRGEAIFIGSLTPLVTLPSAGTAIARIDGFGECCVVLTD